MAVRTRCGRAGNRLMIDLKDLNLDPSRGERLTRQSCRRDFGEQERDVRGAASWKFERRQSFEEPEIPGWAGGWNEAPHHLEEEKTEWSRIAEGDRARANVFHRVRVAEEPLTPSMQVGTACLPCPGAERDGDQGGRRPRGQWAGGNRQAAGSGRSRRSGPLRRRLHRGRGPGRSGPFHRPRSHRPRSHRPRSHRRLGAVHEKSL
jgi:hypothetical protein